MKREIEEARKKVDSMCDELGLDLRNPEHWNRILGEIDRRDTQRRYKCVWCKDSGTIAYIGEDGMFYGRRCARCRYWDDRKGRNAK